MKSYRAELAKLLIRHTRKYRSAVKNGYSYDASENLAIMKKLMQQIDARE